MSVFGKNEPRVTFNGRGQLHNENGPAVLYPSGHEFWYNNGQLHNDNGPAVRNPGINASIYYKHGKVSRPLDSGGAYWDQMGGYAFAVDGKASDKGKRAALYNADLGMHVHCKNGIIHNLSGPAIKFNTLSNKFHFINGIQTRRDGNWEIFADEHGLPKNPCSEVDAFIHIEAFRKK